ncbi:MAG: PilT/PilU family type 4a pilus ATPase, partial [Pirellulales bacterium]|nr:PilT/PilU family type 4a pilus ATPase [Pirellulales bacterium]
MPFLDDLLFNMDEAGASDLHLVVNQPPKYRIDGEVVVVDGYEAFSEEDLGKYLFELMADDEQREKYVENLDFDFAYALGDKFRYRCNYFHQRTGYGAVFRIIPTEILTLEQLNLPPVLTKLTELRAGLVLVTGPTGSGKSTTLAAMIHHINTTSRRHILTIEDPIEFVHHNRESVINHREVGEHTESFGSALRAVTRQDADVVLVGEMRDLETIEAALTLAETGHLTFATLHTSDVTQTVNRIV